MEFKLKHKDNLARVCEITTAHSTFETPIFMPVGTVGAVKSLDAIDLKQKLNAKIILANTYHMYLRPGSKIVKHFGGLHGFTNLIEVFLLIAVVFKLFRFLLIPNIFKKV